MLVKTPVQVSLRALLQVGDLPEISARPRGECELAGTVWKRERFPQHTVLSGGEQTPLSAHGKFDFDSGVFCEGDFVATSEEAEVNRLGKSVRTKASGHVSTGGPDSNHPGDQAHPVGSGRVVAELIMFAATLLVLSGSSSEGKQQRRDKTAFVGVGLHIAFAVDRDVLPCVTFSTTDCAEDLAGGPTRRRDPSDGETKLAVAPETPRRFALHDDAFHARAFRQQQLVRVVEHGLDHDGMHRVAFVRSLGVDCVGEPGFHAYTIETGILGDI